MQPPIDGSRRMTMAGGGFFLAVFAAGMAILRQSERGYAGTTMPGDPGPFFLAGLCLWIVGVAGVLLIAAGLLGRDTVAAADPGEPATRGAAMRAWALCAAFVLSLVAMPALMDGLGTTLAVAVFATPWIAVLLALRDGARWQIAAIAIGLGAGIAYFVHVVFVQLLTLPLPS